MTYILKLDNADEEFFIGGFSNQEEVLEYGDNLIHSLHNELCSAIEYDETRDKEHRLTNGIWSFKEKAEEGCELSFLISVTAELLLKPDLDKMFDKYGNITEEIIQESLAA